MRWKSKAIILISLLTGPAVLAADKSHLDHKTTHAVSPQANDLLLRSPDTPFCRLLRDNYTRSDLPQTASDMLKKIKQIDARTKYLFKERDDGQTDIWNNHALSVIRGENFEGDCDDLSVTAAALAICAGADASSIGLAVVDNPVIGRTDAHLVAFYSTPSGERYAFGDTLKPMDSFKRYENSVQFETTMDKLTQWRIVD